MDDYNHRPNGTGSRPTVKARLLDLSTPQLSRPRSPTPNPAAIEAKNDTELALQKFRHICKLGAQNEIDELLEHWPTSPDGNLTSLDELKVSSTTPLVGEALCEAARHGHAALLKHLAARDFLLIDAETDSLSVPEAAIEGAARSGNTTVLELLIDLGWEPALLYGRRASVLVPALQNEDIVDWLLAHGANPNDPARSDLNLTITTRAAEQAPFSVVKLLLEHGGVVTGTDAVAQAVIGHNNGVPDRLEVVEYLLDNGAPIDEFAYNDKCMSRNLICGLENGLHYAAGGGKKDMVELLLMRGADKNIRSIFRGTRWPGQTRTALEIAETKGYIDIADFLKEN